jgi:truncated hemoglobin YjbI
MVAAAGDLKPIQPRQFSRWVACLKSAAITSIAAAGRIEEPTVSAGANFEPFEPEFPS